MLPQTYRAVDPVSCCTPLAGDSSEVGVGVRQGLADGTWRTPLGILRPGWDGLCALRRAADFSFLQRLWAQDPKSVHHDLALSVPCFEPLRHLAAQGGGRALRTATACATYARVLQRLKHPPAAEHLA